jgi:pimeloyl-ACP methyl ester carboxylesterase
VTDPAALKGAITLGGIRLEFRWAGEDAAGRPDVVLLHEGLGSVAMWKDFPEQLAAATGSRVFLYSRQGHGASDPGPAIHGLDYMHREAERVLPELLARAGVRRPILFGHSDGASIALIHSAARPGEVSGLVLEAPHVFVEPLTVASIAALGGAYETTDLRRRLARHHRDPDLMFRRWNRIWLDPAFRAWDIRDCLPRISAPVLMIQGEDDEYGTRAQLEAIGSAAAGRTEVLMLPACGHAPHRDQTEAVLDRTRRFAASILAATA